MQNLNRRHLLRTASLWGLTGACAVALGACSQKSTRAAALPAGAAVLALGDSLTSGVGASAGQDWPSVLAANTGWRIDNQGVSGDTTAQANARLPALLQHAQYDAILIGIGGNDMLRQQPRDRIVSTIATMLETAKAHCSHVGLIATPEPKLAAALTGSLSDAPFYAELASAHQVLLLDDIYAQVLARPKWRADQVHANAEGYAEIARIMQEKLTAAGWI